MTRASSEAFVVSTCNRVEIVIASEDTVDVHRVIDEFLPELPPGPHFYRHEGRDAIAPEPCVRGRESAGGEPPPRRGDRGMESEHEEPAESEWR